MSADIKLISQDHKSVNKGNYSIDDDDDEPTRRLGLFEIYGILLVRILTFKFGLANFIFNIVIQMVIEYALPLVIISFAYAHMGTRLWLTRTPGTAQGKRDECILSNKKKVYYQTEYD